MRPNPLFASDDPGLVRELIRDNPWATLVSHNDGEVVASHYPVRHGYVSSSWYPPSLSNVPTWNFTVAHCYGTPEILEEDENLAVLTRLVGHFEREVESPSRIDPEQGPMIAKGTVGIPRAD